jgi:hypothetical protein
MSVHKESSFEARLCAHPSTHVWLYEGDATAYDGASVLFPADVLAWQTAQSKASYITPQNNLMKHGAIVAGLSSEPIGSLSIVLPPRKQRAAMQCFQSELGKFDTFAAAALLQERQTTLIRRHPSQIDAHPLLQKEAA